MNQNGFEQQQDTKTGEDGEKAGGKNIGFPVMLVQAEADDSVDDAAGNKGKQKISDLYHQIDSAVLRFGEHSGVQRHKKKDKHLGTEGADSKDHSVGNEFSIFVQSDSPDIWIFMETGREQFSASGNICKQNVTIISSFS